MVKYTRWNIDSVREFVKSNSDCELLSTEYKTVDDKMSFLCRCGDEFETTWERFVKREKRRCNKCSYKKNSSSKRLEHEVVKNFIEQESKSGCKLLSDKYTNNRSLLTIKCKCGNEFNVSFSQFKNTKSKRRCDDCIELKDPEKLKKTFEGFKQFIVSICLDWMKLKLLDNAENDYIDFYSRVSLQDDLGYMYHSSYNSVYNSYKNKSDLIKFSKYNKYTIYNINHWIKLNNKQLELLSTEFINNKHKLSWRCAEGHKFESLFNNILKGHGCPYCAGQGRPTIEFVKEKFLENNYILLSNEYKNNSTKLKYICKKHFDIGIQEIAWSGFYNQGNGCYYCGLEKRALSQLKTHEKYSEEVYNLVGDEYTVLGDYKKGMNTY